MGALFLVESETDQILKVYNLGLHFRSYTPRAIVYCEVMEILAVRLNNQDLILPMVYSLDST